jgi:hypothetical protein
MALYTQMQRRLEAEENGMWVACGCVQVLT